MKTLLLKAIAVMVALTFSVTVKAATLSCGYVSKDFDFRNTNSLDWMDTVESSWSFGSMGKDKTRLWLNSGLTSNTNVDNETASQPPISVPCTMLLLGSGLLGTARILRKRKHNHH